MGTTGIDLRLRLTLREGSVYYFEERHLTSPEPHYFIVVNSDPLAQKVLLLSVVTSQVDSVKLRRCKTARKPSWNSPRLIFNVLTKPSIVDCNDLKEVPLAEFNTRFVRKEIRCFDRDLPVALRKALRQAIHASKILSAEIKTLVAKP